MIIRSAELKTVCGYTSKLPHNMLCEVAFAGRSNVGKSSLINAIMNRKSLARTSSQPGKTQTINYYLLNENLYLVDLPGYGYAKVSQQEKEKWGKLIDRYLHSSRDLRAVFLLVDIRHDPTNDDKMMYDWMVANGFSPIVIATKSDKIKRSQLNKQLAAIRRKLQMQQEELLIPFSALNKSGTEEIRDLLEQIQISYEGEQQI